MKKRTLYFSLPVLVLSLILWIKSYLIKESPYELIHFVQTRFLNKLCTAEKIEIEAALIGALVYVGITFMAVLLLCSAMVSFIYEKSLIESARKQLCRNFAFFGLLPHVLVSLGWNFIWGYLPAKPANYIAPIIEIEPLLNFTASFDGLVLYLSVVSAVLISLAFSFGICINSNIWFNRICGILWCIFAYDTLYITTPYFEYGKWFLLFALICYIPVGVSIFIYRNKSEEPLTPKYEVLIISGDDFNNTEDALIEEYNEYDFSIFMPKENNKKERKKD